MNPPQVRITPRLEVRPPREEDRSRFVDLFGDAEFMVFSSGALTHDAANQRFDHMVEMCERVPFAKQAVVERDSGSVLGYTGVDLMDFENDDRFEWGYRLTPESRGQGYATEASMALLMLAGETFSGELLAVIDPSNEPSQNVCRKLGFSLWKQATIDAVTRNVFTLSLAREGRLTVRGPR